MTAYNEKTEVQFKVELTDKCFLTWSINIDGVYVMILPQMEPQSVTRLQLYLAAGRCEYVMCECDATRFVFFFRKWRSYSVGIPLTKRHSSGSLCLCALPGPAACGGNLMQMCEFMYNKVSLCPPLLLSKTSDVTCKPDLTSFIIHIVQQQSPVSCSFQTVWVVADDPIFFCGHALSVFCS